MAAGYDGSIRIDTRVDTKGFNTGMKQISGGLAGIASSLGKLAGAVGLTFGVKAIIDFSKESVKAATDLSNAMMGLQSIMEGQGRSFAKAQQFINDYISDGLIPATDAITAYKNLASRKYTDTQIQQVLVALKDSASFGRQASYSLGEAVETATEGLKNENSILVDNAGVTKNVARMWDEYAKSIGTTAANLSQQQKIQAEVTGILEESKYQIGDAAKVADSYSGQILKLGFNFNNLKVAVGNAIIPLAQAVLPSINAIIAGLTRLANVFAQVTAALFGKQVKAQEQVAKTAAAGAKAENSLAKATEKAGKAAKGSLASFDELNVLAEDTAAGMGAAANGIEDTSFGGVDTDAGLSGELGADMTVSPAVQTAVDTFMRILEPLQSIKLDNLNAAFDRLKEAIRPITAALFAGLEWAYLNIFVPLAEWTIEDALPAFLDVLSGALKVLSAVIEALTPLALWLFENFLRPIAEWTGGLIVASLEALAGALKGVSDWISENEGLVQGMTVTVGLFFAAWKGTELLAFIQMSGGVAGAFKIIKDAIKGATIAQIANKWETVALTGLYAKDFVVSIGAAAKAIAFSTGKWAANTFAMIANKIAMGASVIAQGAMTFAMGTWNVICAIGTGLTAAFGAAVAFLTSPIGLVLLAIAALIAIIVLLVTHWDKVKAAAAAVWTEITKIWGVASGWFNQNVLTPLKNNFKGAINFLIGLAEGFVNGFIKGINKIISALNTLSFENPITGKAYGINIRPVREISIPRLATGGITSGPMLAMIGDNPGGREVVAPLDDLTDMIASAVGDAVLAVMQMVQRNTSNQGGDIVIQVDGATFARIIKPYLAREDQRKGSAIIKPI
ncbi:hypothetical protein Sgly_0352 [Syntrophobotulus glycolicus DSM 8271]|uniref:Uncharacterized protein n=1 Tax=Syntrophobotulus glycolicus (strain DSM 8271 / FlGlyR) TaxID=645991 RepID=F0SXH2_SYNGF|nr:hypothetical protein [Syntrophobotulus glycolicus]ADY54718.1 hypothetical protein Sgly_0352 [Syntrophobotulus glycolicus DSM 8271]